MPLTEWKLIVIDSKWVIKAIELIFQITTNVYNLLNNFKIILHIWIQIDTTVVFKSIYFIAKSKQEIMVIFPYWVDKPHEIPKLNGCKTATLFTLDDQIGLLLHIYQRPLENPRVLQHRFRLLLFWSAHDCCILATWRIVLALLFASHIFPRRVK